MISSKPTITVVGSINMDLVIRCERIPLSGQTIMAESSAEFCGGKGANQAVAAARAGGDVVMIGRVGSDALADRLLANLKLHGVDTRCLARCDDCASGLAVIAVDDSGQNSIMVVPGANARVSIEDIEAAKSTIQKSDVLLLQLEVPMESVIRAIQIAKQSGVRVVLDPAPAPEQWPSELLRVDLLCPNETEAAALVGQSVKSREQAADAARKLRAMGAANVAITMGGQGTLMLSDDRCEFIPAYPVDAVDTTAAGDAFAGALAVRWSEQTGLVEAASFAAAAGALAASRPGAQTSMASRQEIETFWRTRRAAANQPHVRIDKETRDSADHRDS